MKVSFKGNEVSRLVQTDHDSSLRLDKLLLGTKLGFCFQERRGNGLRGSVYRAEPTLKPALVISPSPQNVRAVFKVRSKCLQGSPSQG